jgi:plasmid maintenance system killer protein
LLSRRRNRSGNRWLKEDLENQVVRILRDRYPDFGPTLATEKLEERHQIALAKETVRRIQIEAGLWTPRKLRPPKVQQPRCRRACLGKLVQIDGCEHAWFEDRDRSARRSCLSTMPRAATPNWLTEVSLCKPLLDTCQPSVYTSSVLKSFRSKVLAELWSSGSGRKIDSRLHERILRRLDRLDAATSVTQMDVPGFDFHPLRGKPQRYSVHVNGPWCVTFEFEGGDALRVDLEQYH